MTNHFYRFIFSFLVVLSSIAGCKKPEKATPVAITFIAPEASSIFQVPDTILVKFNIESKSPIHYVRVSIDNEDLIPVSPQLFIYPVDSMRHFEIPVPVGALSAFDSMNYYVHLVVENDQKTTHEFMEIKLSNKPFAYKGFSVVTEEDGNKSRIYFYDEYMTETAQLSVIGKITHAVTARESDLLILTTAIPEILSAYSYSDLKLQWSRDPQLPYPEFTFIRDHSPLLYFGNGAGQVISTYSSTGLEVYNTPIFSSYYPTHLVANTTKLVIAYKSRTGLSSMLNTCYRTTGALQHQYLIDFELVFGLQSGESETVVLFGNINNSGRMLNFDPDENQLISTHVFDFGSISQVVPIGDITFLIHSASGLFQVDSETGIATQINFSVNEIEDMAWEQEKGRLFIAAGNEVLLLSYPDLDLINKLTFNNKVLKITTRYTR